MSTTTVPHDFAGSVTLEPPSHDYPHGAILIDHAGRDVLVSPLQLEAVASLTDPNARTSALAIALDLAAEAAALHGMSAR